MPEGATSRQLACPAYALRVIGALESAGYEAWAVGGWVRDALLGLPEHDVDVTSSAPWQEAERVLREAGMAVHETGAAHGTVTAVSDGRPVEVTTYRVEGSYTDHRHPDEVRFVRDVREDLARRDFTINAMAWHPSRGLLDPFGGERDLSLRLVRTVGDPAERFGEDALRVLRAVRFAARMGFSVEGRTQRALVEAAGSLRGIARERVGQELDGIVGSGRVAWALREEAAPLLVAVPELDGTGAEGLGRTARTCALVEALAGGQAAHTLRWAGLLHGIGPSAAEAARLSGRVLRRLAIPSEVSRPTCALVASLGWPRVPTREGARRLLAGLARDAGGSESALAFQALELAGAWEVARGGSARDCEGLARALRQELAAGPVYEVSQLQVGGRDVIRLGTPPGPAVGRALAALLEATMRGEVPNERAAQLAWLGRAAATA